MSKKYFMKKYSAMSQIQHDSSNDNCNDGDSLSSTAAVPSSKEIYNHDYQNILVSKINAVAVASSSNKKTRLPYSLTEDISIVKYIIENNYAFEVSGTSIWKKMEQDNLCLIRSWQSMKKRYMQHIKYDIAIKHKEKYPFITPDDIEILLYGLNSKKRKINRRQASPL